MNSGETKQHVYVAVEHRNNHTPDLLVARERESDISSTERCCRLASLEHKNPTDYNHIHTDTFRNAVIIKNPICCV